MPSAAGKALQDGLDQDVEVGITVNNVPEL
jgi:hypothetical protein